MIKKRETALRAIENGYPKIHIWSPELKADPELCSKAIKCNGHAITNVSREIITEEMCLDAVSQGATLFSIPDKFRSKKVCQIALSKRGTDLRYVPSDIIDKELCDQAVRTSAAALQYVPKQLQDENMLMEVFKINGNLMCHAKEELLNEDLCLTAVRNFGSSIKFVPDRLKTEKICMTAVKNHSGLNDIPEDKKTDELLLAFIENNGILNALPRKRVAEVFKMAIISKSTEKIVPTEAEVKEWKEHLYNAIQDLTDNDSATPNDSLDALLETFLHIAHVNGGYHVDPENENKLCKWLDQEYKKMYI